MVIEKHIKIIHPAFGELLNDTYNDDVQFKLFLKMVNSCINLKQDLSVFNGQDFLLHIPYELLRQSMIMGNTRPQTLADYAIQKSKMEG
jgi:hypothetical protein|tara:strand:+ start:1156 stop:1422 length:267 start_codon:yes stop_codon:yes gene_type:complete